MNKKSFSDRVAAKGGKVDNLFDLFSHLAVLWRDYPLDMKPTLLNAKKDNHFALSGTCPHCRKGSVFTSATVPHAIMNYSTGREELAAPMQCPGCAKYILGIVARRGDEAEYLAHYPVGSPDDAVDPNVPAAIAADFSEALRCVWVRSHKAAVAMCRRSVEASCIDLNAKGKNLYQKIDDLADNGIITDPLRRMAHRVRLTANAELHGKKGKQADTAKEGEALSVGDDLADVVARDAEAMIAFVREFFHHVYVMPALLKAYEEPEPEEAE